MRTLQHLAMICAISFFGCSTSSPTPAPEVKAEAQYAEVFKPHEAAFSSCYANFGKGLPIDLTVNFRTNFSGQLQSMEMDKEKSTPTSPNAFNECILKEFSKAEFSKVTGDYRGIRGSYSFHFKK